MPTASETAQNSGDAPCWIPPCCIPPCCMPPCCMPPCCIPPCCIPGPGPWPPYGLCCAIIVFCIGDACWNPPCGGPPCICGGPPCICGGCTPPPGAIIVRGTPPAPIDTPPWV